MKATLGGKGAGLAEMTNLGVPVPPGFTISADLCIEYIKTRHYPTSLKEEVGFNLQRVEELCGRTFGSAKNPLLVSVRSGAATSMPGMMDTHPQPRPQRRGRRGTREGHRQSRLRLRRLPPLRADVRRRRPRPQGRAQSFEGLLHKQKQARKVERDIDPPADDLKDWSRRSRMRSATSPGEPFPEDRTPSSGVRSRRCGGPGSVTAP